MNEVIHAKPEHIKHPFYRALTGQLMKMLNRNLDRTPAATEMPAVIMQMFEDFLNTGMELDAVDIQRLEIACVRYIRGGATRFPMIAHLRECLPSRQSILDEQKRQKRLSIDPDTRQREEAKNFARRKAMAKRWLESLPEDLLKGMMAARRKREREAEEESRYRARRNKYRNSEVKL